jgi:hypothetical protein
MAKATVKKTPPVKPAVKQPRPKDESFEDARKKLPAEVKNSPLAVGNEQLPDYMRQDIGKGAENIGSEDLEIPRLKLIQALSPELETYDELRAGNFFHSAAEFIFDEPFLGVVLYTDRRYILWNPRDSGGGILARADDGIHWQPANAKFTVKLDKKDGGEAVTWVTAPTVQQSGLANWGSMNPKDPNSAPAATLMYNFILAFPEHLDLMPAVLTFQRSAVRNGRRLNTKLKTSRAPIFGMLFRFTPTDDVNRSGQKFFNVQAAGAGFLQDQKLYQAYKEQHEGFRAAGLKIKDLEGLQQDEGDSDTHDDGDAGGEGDEKPAF